MQQNLFSTENKASVSFQLNMTSLWFWDYYFSKTKVTKLMYIDTNPRENYLQKFPSEIRKVQMLLWYFQNVTNYT